MTDEEQASTPSADDAHAAAHRGHSLRVNVVYAALGAGALNAARFGVIVLLAKFATTEILGQYTFALAVATPVAMFFSLQLRGALVADARGQFSFGTYRVVQSAGRHGNRVRLAEVGSRRKHGERGDRSSPEYMSCA